MNSNLDNLTAAKLRRAAYITDQIENLQAVLAHFLSGNKKPVRKPVKKAAAKNGGARKKAGARKKKVPKKKVAKKTAKKKTAKKKASGKKAKRSLSPAARKAMSDARKAYWANKRKEAGKK